MLQSETKAAFKGAIIGGLITALAGFGTMCFSEYLQYGFDKGRQIESAYFQVLAAQERIELISPQNSTLPLNRFLFDGTDWNVVLIELQNENAEKIYFQLRALDDLRDKILETTNREDKLLLETEYWRLFSELKANDKLDTFIKVLYKHRLSVETEKTNEAE